MVKSFKNGDKVLDSCLFCGGTFEEPETLGTKIICPSESEGGCGAIYKVSMYNEPSVKSDSE